MAQELNISGLLISFAKTGSPSRTLRADTITPTVAGTQYMDNVQLVGTSEEAVLVGDVAPGGYWFVQNMDSTNFVQLRQATGATAFCKLLAGEWACFRASVDMTAPFAIADTASCNVRFLMFDL